MSFPTGGPRLLRTQDDRSYYTGDSINPLVLLRYLDGSRPANATVQLTLSRPNASIGNVLSQERLRAPVTIAGDTIPARQVTLAGIERELGTLISFVDETFDLSNEPSETGGIFEESGTFGKSLSDKFIAEGDYFFRFRASVGQGCTVTRELLWSLHVDIGIDPSRTNIAVIFTGRTPDKQRTGVVTIVPRDRYRNQLGPGRTDAISVTGSAGTTIIGTIIDDGNGSYTIPISWNPGSHNPPGVVVGQPARPPIVVQQGNCKTELHNPPNPYQSLPEEKWEIDSEFSLTQQRFAGS